MSERKVFIILSKDAQCRDYYHFYGEREGQMPTPNIDALITQGTLFMNHYTAAASTVMSFYSMATEKFAHETDIQMYEECHERYMGETFFTKLHKLGYEECHMIWDEMWDVLPKHHDYFREDVVIHSIKELRESVGVHKKKEGDLFSDDEKAMTTLAKIESLIKDIVDNDKSVFVWLHLPHVVSGRACYGADIDMYDRYVGMVRRYFPDNCIALTTDHGNLNGFKGKLAYGFDVYEKIARIPLVTPRIDNYEKYTSNTSNVDLFSILFEKKIPNREFVYCDSAYRAQKTRRLAIIYDHYKYIYNKRDNTEELYDLKYNPEENMNLIKDHIWDIDRRMPISIREEFYYPAWDKLPAIREKMRAEKKRIWRNGDLKIVIKSDLKDLIRPLADIYYKYFKR